MKPHPVYVDRYKELKDFIDGQKDCRDGIPHRPGMSGAYTRGYNYQYEIEQVKTELSRSMQSGY